MYNIESFRNYCLKKAHVTESFPFDEDTLVFKVANKMFALSSLESPELSVNLKCDPERALELRENYPDAAFPGYHMSKIHWNTVLPNQGITLELWKEMIDESYNLIVKSLPKKTQRELGFLE